MPVLKSVKENPEILENTGVYGETLALFQEANVSFPDTFLLEEKWTESLAVDQGDSLISSLAEKKESLSSKALKNKLLLDVVVPGEDRLETALRFSTLGLCAQNLSVLHNKLPLPAIKKRFYRLLLQVLALLNDEPNIQDLINQSDKSLDGHEMSAVLENDEAEVLNKILAAKDAAEFDQYFKEASERQDSFFQQFFSTTKKQVLAVFALLAEKLIHTEARAVFIQKTHFHEIATADFKTTLSIRDLQSGDANIAFINTEAAIEFTGAKPVPLKVAAQKKIESTLKKLEKHAKDLFLVDVIVEKGIPYCLDFSEALESSARANVLYRLNRLKKNYINDRTFLKNISLDTLRQLLIPRIDRSEAVSAHQVTGGVAGSYGAASGKVYFSAEALLKAYEEDRVHKREEKYILAMPATYADEVKAIKIADAVISSEGGYASHAPVVARSMGKTAVVMPDIHWNKRAMEIQGEKVREGQTISLDVQMGQVPVIYFEELKLESADTGTNGLVDILGILEKQNIKTKVYANADQEEEAAMALELGAQGIGLCRTEHMFFNQDRLFPFLRLLLSIEKTSSLKTIEKEQSKDFERLFSLYKDREVTIRLLDAPLHEFIPRSKEAVEKFHQYLLEQGDEVSLSELNKRLETLHEANPMLGHRGVRMGISRPEIYHMQVRAICKAYLKMVQKNHKVYPKIMIPLIMHGRELHFIRHGKKIEGESIPGLKQTLREALTEKGKKPKSIPLGCMIELPSAALEAGYLARWSEFFSFGTNDLTQTAYGLSRDDSALFLSDYEKYGIQLSKNPFSVLEPAVQELINVACRRGRMVRPDIPLSLCGEHGGNPENIQFIIENEIDVISCSAPQIPAVKLALFQAIA